MTDKGVFSASYADLKFIKSRKVCQIVLELPIEAASSFLDVFGAPNPASETWVAVARLQSPQEAVPVAVPIDYDIYDVNGRKVLPKQHRPFSSLPMPQQAALRCQDMSFREWLREYYSPDILTAEDAAKFVRDHCGVTSRSDIRPGTYAEKIWERLNLRYALWESARAA